MAVLPAPPAEASRALLAARCAGIEPFEVMEVLARARALAAAGRSIVHMEIGEPDFPAAPRVAEAASEALRRGHTAYTEALGLPALRTAIASHYAGTCGIAVQPDRVAVTAGASGALLLTLACVCGPDDEVITADPGYPGYRTVVRVLGAEARLLPVGPQSDFQPTRDALAALWSARTRALIIGTPANPTGSLIDPAELHRIAEFVAARGGWLILDEIYQGLSYDTAPATGAGLPGNVVVVNSFSKYFCMTGWRLGWALVPPQAMRAFETMAQHLYICPPTVAQYAALACFHPESLALFEARREEFRRRRDLLLDAFRQAGLAVPVIPGGAFYIYADVSGSGLDSRQFTLRLLEEEGVAATPGHDFGLSGRERYVRFAYTRATEEVMEGARRITAFVRRRSQAGDSEI